MPLNDFVMRGLKRSARGKQAFFEHPKATRRRAHSPKVRRQTDSSRGELSRNLTPGPVNFARSAFRLRCVLASLS